MEKMIEGYVKGVLSGDMISISGKIKKGSDNAPEEKTLILSLLQAPKINSSTTYEEDPCGWESRLYLRDMLIGKIIKYSIDYKVNDMQYGQVNCDGKNVNLEMVKNGYVKVNTSKSGEVMFKTDYFNKVKKAEEDAKKSKLGIWKYEKSSSSGNKGKDNKKDGKITSEETKSSDISEPKRIKIIKQDEVNKKDLFNQIKGKTIKGMIEFVFNCSGFLIILKDPYNCIIKASLRFVAIPSKNTEFYSSGKAYTERLFGHRDVNVKVHHLEEETGNFIVDIWDTRKNKDGKEETKNLAHSVLQQAYSKMYVSSSFDNDKFDTDFAKEAQSKAQELGIRVWEGYVNPIKKENKATNNNNNNITQVGNFEGFIQQVHSGDSLSVKDSKGNVHRIYLSHIKARPFAKANTDEEDKPWAWQAKEYVRKTFLGKNVKAEFEYSKEIKDGRVMHFYTVFIVENQKTTTNLGVDILENGFAEYVSPKMNDSNISKYIDDYSNAFKKARDDKKGLHSNKDPGLHSYCDLINANPKKKRDFIPRNANLGRNVPCIVEHVYSAIKTKLRIDKSSSYIPFKLIGLKCIEKDNNNTQKLNDLHLKSVDYVTDKFLQREGTVDIVHNDKNGNYFGFLTINNESVGNAVLKEGYAIIHNPQNTVLKPEYKKMEEIASKNKSNIWGSEGLITLLKESDVNNIVNDSSALKNLEEKNDVIKLRVTDMVDFKEIFINILPNKELSKIDEVLGKYDSGDKKGVLLQQPIKVGTNCIAYYDVDQSHYRVRINGLLKDNKASVEFIDYGTIDTVSVNFLYKLEDSLSLIKPQVVNCELACLKYSKNSHKKSIGLYPNIIDLDKVVNGRIVYTYLKYGKLKTGIIIYDDKPNNIKSSIQGNLIQKGYAKLDNNKPITKCITELKELENKSKENNLGMWATMEQSDNEDDDNDI